MKVILESPYAGFVTRNIEYARKCMRDSLLRGEYPIASHLLYTQEGILNDGIPHERILGIEAGLHWGEEAEKTVVYTDYGISSGMLYGIQRAEQNNRPIEYREILKDETCETCKQKRNDIRGGKCSQCFIDEIKDLRTFLP